MLFRLPGAGAACLAVCLTLVACRTAPPASPLLTTPAEQAEALAGLPTPTSDPPLALDDDDDLERARAAYEALPLTDDGRAARRTELWHAYQGRIEAQLGDGALDLAEETFATAMGMWTGTELADESKAAPGLDLVQPTAEKLYGVFSRSGHDAGAATAITVLRAADPSAQVRTERQLADLLDFADDLQVATHGAGAKHARPVRILETVTERVASPWAARLLAERYLERQGLWNAAALNPNLEISGSQDAGISAPIWALVRAYARMDKLESLPPVLDTLTGQRGDNAELRKVLREAVGPGTTADMLVELGKSFLDTRMVPEPDYVTARHIAMLARTRFPTADSPRRLLGLIALRQGYLPLAEAELAAVLRQDADDRELASLYSRVLIVEMNDLVQGERRLAGEAKRKKLEAFYAEADKRWPGKPLEPGLAEVWASYGRGLYALGDIDAAVVWLDKANTIAPSADALELLGQIHHRRGRHAQAVKSFEAAAALPRETPLEKKVAEARLLRLAAESRAAAGDRRGAEQWWRAAEQKWNELLGSGLSDGQRILGFTERGRILWALGQRSDALADFEAAVDAAGKLEGASAAFSDVIAFLFPRGAYDAALDTYHRGLARRGATEYTRIYTSLWVVAAARLRGAEPNRVAMNFLASRSGTRWYHDLARYTTGRIDFATLMKKADTRGKRAEAFFYEALARFAAGDREGGEHFIRLSLATDMMGFFEYEMAAVILQYGPPTH
jgi:tetratricopeptide (TPR) repeat protein